MRKFTVTMSDADAYGGAYSEEDLAAVILDARMFASVTVREDQQSTGESQ